MLTTIWVRMLPGVITSWCIMCFLGAAESYVKWTLGGGEGIATIFLKEPLQKNKFDREDNETYLKAVHSAN